MSCQSTFAINTCLSVVHIKIEEKILKILTGYEFSDKES
jgi:hypothetical protein